MTDQVQSSQSVGTETKTNTTEQNIAAIRLKYERELAQERAARAEAERAAREAQLRHNPVIDDDEDAEPYVDHKKLEKKLAKFGEQTQKQTQSEIQKAVQLALHEERKQNWIKQNGDFYDVLQHAEKLAQKDPELAESILEMPEGFERQKLVYKNIKALGLHKPQEKNPSIQEKIEANRRSPYYQSSGVGTSPYSSQSDYSPQGQKNAYEKMQELKSRLRLG